MSIKWKDICYILYLILALRDALPSYLKGLVTFGYKSGWRISEICNLTWNRVDLKAGFVRLEAGETKNDEARTVYLDDELKAIFKELFSQRKLDIPFVFLRDGEPIKGFRKAWLKTCKETGLNGKIFHDLRRTAYRNKVRAGVPERVAMQEGGWKTRSVADRYNIVSDEDLRLASKKLETYLNRQDVTSTGTISGTVVKFQEKRSTGDPANPFLFLLL